MATLAILNVRQLLSLAGPRRPRFGQEMRELGIISRAGMFVEDGRVRRVGGHGEIERLCSSDTEIVDAGGRVVLPGFVDAHTHAVFAGNRLEDYLERINGASYEQIAAGGGGIGRTVELTRAASEDELLKQARKHAEWFLRNGTTTIEAKSGYGLSSESELKTLRTIRRLNEETPLRCVPTFLGAHAIPKEYEARRQDYLRLVLEEMMPAVKEEGLAKFCDVFCEEGYFTTEEAREVLSRAADLGFGLRIHADQLSNNGGALVAAELRARTADHLECIDDLGLAALRAANVLPVLLPGSVHSLNKDRYPPAAAMIDLGCPVVLASDFNPGSSPIPSMPVIHSLACLKMGMQPAECVVASTINAAYSLNLGHEIGSLEEGKAADFAIWDCEDYREIAYFLGAPLAWRVYVGGGKV